MNGKHRTLETNVETRESTRNKLDVHFMEMSINLSEIKTDGYEIGISHRPIKKSLVNKIKENFSVSDKPVVAYSCMDGLYHAVTRQELVEAAKELNDEEKIQIKDIACDIIFRKSASEVLDAKLADDRLLCFEYAYTSDDFEGKNCTADAIFMTLYLADAYKNKIGESRGDIDYVYEHQFGCKKYPKSYIEKLMSYGHKLRELNLIRVAQEERWTEYELDREIGDYQIGSNIKELKLQLPTWAYKRLEEKRIFDADFLLTLARSLCDAGFIKEVIAHEDKKQSDIMERIFKDINQVGSLK